MSIFVTSDLHIGHNKPFLYEPRGFKSIEEHDNALVKNFNSVVQPTDIVYILGDIMLNDLDYGCEIFNKLNGTKIIIRGNHDTDNKLKLYEHLNGVLKVVDAIYVTSGKYNFYLTHFPSKVGNRHKLVNLCGHVHTKDRFKDFGEDKIYHVELDAHNMFPVNLEDIKKDISDKLQNKFT